MRVVAMGLLLLLAGCDSHKSDEQARFEAQPAAVAFDGADYENQAGKVAHGKRLSSLFGCSSCHGPNYTGVNFGEFIPIVQGLWASNISLTMPKLSDAELASIMPELVIRDSVGPPSF